MRSLGWRFIIVGILCLIMLVPLGMVSEIVWERQSYSESTIRSVGKEWGGEQLLSGPQVVIPVRATETVTRTVDVIDPDSGEVVFDTETKKPRRKQITEEQDVAREPLFLYPDVFDVVIDSQTQMRHRGIFQVPVYTASARIDLEFPFERLQAQLQEREYLVWEAAELRLHVSSNRALRGEANLTGGGKTFLLEPMSGQAGLVAALGDKPPAQMRLQLGFNGAAEMMLVPAGRSSNVTIKGDWPDPSFRGAFLPDDHEITDAGFEAHWTIPHLARSLPQIARVDQEAEARRNFDFGLRFQETNDFYQKAWRAARYGILFISLTFLTVLLMDMKSARPVHPVQYLLIGLAQAVFTLLMLAYAEQIGFAGAYLGASTAVILLLVMFGAFALKMGKRALVLGAMLVLLYAVLFLILYSTDYALVSGATLAFLAVAATMYGTRNEEWYGEDGPKSPFQWLRRSPANPGAASMPPPSPPSELPEKR